MYYYKNIAFNDNYTAITLFYFKSIKCYITKQLFKVSKTNLHKYRTRLCLQRHFVHKINLLGRKGIVTVTKFAADVVQQAFYLWK